MPYEEEQSSLQASSNFNKMFEESNFKSAFVRNDKAFIENMVSALDYAFNNDFILFSKPNKSIIYDNIYCIDGSIVNLGTTDFKIALQIGAAYMDINDIMTLNNHSLLQDPAKVASLYNHSNNIRYQSIFPGLNSYYKDSRNSRILSQKDSFLNSVNYFLNSNQKHKEIKAFLLSLLNLTICPYCKQKHIYNFDVSNLDYDITLLSKSQKCPYCNHSIMPFKGLSKLLENIRDDFSSYNCTEEVKKFMLLMENLLGVYLLSKHNHENTLIILDGRLHNFELGSNIKEYFRNMFINTDNYIPNIMGVQKTGMLNQYLSSIHEIIIKLNQKSLTQNDKQTNGIFSRLVSLYQNNFPIIIRVDNQFKDLAKLAKTSTNGNYGQEYLYISGEDKKEFVFTLPTNFDNPEINKQIINNIFSKIVSIFEYTNTNLFYKDKGAIMANALAHDNVALNKNVVNFNQNIKDVSKIEEQYNRDNKLTIF